MDMSPAGATNGVSTAAVAHSAAGIGEVCQQGSAPSALKTPLFPAQPQHHRAIEPVRLSDYEGLRL